MINLWDPTHVSVTLDLMTAFLLGIMHGITPDEHTWPITFSYAVGSYSTWKGLRAGLTFSLAFTVQRTIASELAWAGFGRYLNFPGVEGWVFLAVGAVMIWSGWRMGRGRLAPHLRLPFLHEKAAHREVALQDPRPWMPALHGFIAGWGFGAFATILFTVLAPAMPTAALGAMPGLLFGLGTTLTQIIIGAAVGRWASHRNLPPDLIRKLGLATAARTLFWGGLALFTLGLLDVFLPQIADISIPTGIKIHNLDAINLPLMVVMVVVLGIGVGGMVRQARQMRALPRTKASN